MSTLFLLSFLAVMLASILYLLVFGEKTPFGNTAVIKVNGVIMTGKEGGSFYSTQASSDDIIKFLKEAQKDDTIKAVIIDINSPGGSAVASSEIANAIKKVREKKPVVSIIREVGASGGYWIASATEKIFANPLSTTGSIGVISSYLDFAGLIENYNVSYERLTFGKYKDAGSPFRHLTSEERSIMLKKLGIVGNAFIDAVAANRNMSREKTAEYATGLAFLGSEAMAMGLIDEYGGQDEAVKYLENKLNITVKLTEYQKAPTIVEILAGASASSGFNPFKAGTMSPQAAIAQQAMAYPAQNGVPMTLAAAMG